MKKILMYVGIGIIVLLIVVSVVVGMFVGPIVKVGIETVGPKIIKAPITVDGVGVSLITGSADINGLIVGNPEGYRTPQAIKLGNASISLDPFSVMSKKIVIHSIHVKSPEITFEGSLGGSNLSRIQANANSVVSKGGPAPASNAPKDNKPAPKIEIDDFLITGAKVHVSLRGLSGNEVTVPLPDIHLTNIGKDSDGATPTEIVSTVLNSVTKATVKAVAQVVSGSTKIIGGLGKDVGSEASKSIKSITGSLGGLFGK